LNARWVAATVPAAAEALAAAGIPRRTAQLLALRGVVEPDAALTFLSPRREALTDPGRIAGFGAALERLARAAESGERIAIVGDYDVDGVTATALLAAALRASGAAVATLLPRRDAEGYGLQPLHAARAAELGATLLVAADSGTNAHDAAGEAARRGLDLVVVDHHLPEGEPPAGALCVNSRLGAPEAAAELTAAGLALRLAAALLERRGRGVPWAALLRLAALGTIADVAPLLGDNRIVAALGLAALAETPSPGLRALLERAAVRAPVSAGEVAFRVAPRLNAAGRLASAESALELLLTRDARRGRELAAELDALNAERQRIEEAVLAEARAEHAARARDGGAPWIAVSWRSGWHRGVVGIAAARLAREAHRPAILLALDGERAVGSGRSAEGIALHDFLRPWAGRLERFGGHAQAIGLTVRAERLPALRAEWEEAAADWAPRLAERTRRYDLELALAEVGEPLLDELARLEPFGAGNPEPLFRFSACRLAGEPREFGRGHLGFAVAPAESDAARSAASPQGAATPPGTAPLPVVAWRAGERALDLAGRFDLLAAVERDRPGGVRLRLVDLRPAAP
jgi:single-stranded-DNA-specific exonuclease